MPFNFVSLSSWARSFYSTTDVVRQIKPAVSDAVLCAEAKI